MSRDICHAMRVAWTEERHRQDTRDLMLHIEEQHEDGTLQHEAHVEHGAVSRPNPPVRESRVREGRVVQAARLDSLLREMGYAPRWW